MELIPVESSNIAAIGWESGLLRVRFKDGVEYEYPDVSDTAHAALMAAPSKGRWLREWRTGKLISTGAPDKPVGEMIRQTKAETDSDWSYAIV